MTTKTTKRFMAITALLAVATLGISPMLGQQAFAATSATAYDSGYVPASGTYTIWPGTSTPCITDSNVVLKDASWNAIKVNWDGVNQTCNGETFQDGAFTVYKNNQFMKYYAFSTLSGTASFGEAHDGDEIKVYIQFNWD